MGFNATGDLGALTMYTTVRGNMVAFPKSPPLNPPSQLQTQMRNFYRLAASAWRGLTPQDRDAWSNAARRASLRITGYNLFIYWQRTKDVATLKTIERQSGITLIS